MHNSKEALTLRSTSTTHIVDQLQKIKTEWEILERAQQHVLAEKQAITDQIAEMERQTDKNMQKKEIRH